MKKPTNKIFYITQLLLLALISCNENIELGKTLEDIDNSELPDSTSFTVLAEDICSGKSILGTVGTATCQAATDFRFHDVGDTSTARIFPDFNKDSTNYNFHGDPTGFNFPSSQNILENSRPNVTCGTFGSISSRISDCINKNPNNARWVSEMKSNTTHHSNWSLITRTASGKLIWQDEKTKLIWSDVMIRSNWCRASGSGSSTCDSLELDLNSICAEGGGRLSGTGEDWSNGQYDEAKGEMGLNSTTGKIRWRLPSQEDFMLAHAAGLHYAYPITTKVFWTSTPILTSAETRAIVYSFSDTGLYGDDYSIRFSAQLLSSSSYPVRCVGTEI